MLLRRVHVLDDEGSLRKDAIAMRYVDQHPVATAPRRARRHRTRARVAIGEDLLADAQLGKISKIVLAQQIARRLLCADVWQNIFRHDRPLGGSARSQHRLGWE